MVLKNKFIWPIDYWNFIFFTFCFLLKGRVLKK
jgi:hypothetical protein